MNSVEVELERFDELSVYESAYTNCGLNRNILLVDRKLKPNLYVTALLKPQKVSSGVVLPPYELREKSCLLEFLR